MKRIIVVGLLVAACGGAVCAEQAVRLRERFAGTDGVLLVASVPSGSVHLVPTDGDEVVVEGVIADGMTAPTFATSSDGRVLQFVLSAPGRRIGADAQTRLEVRFPSFCSLRVDGFSSSIAIEADGGQRAIEASTVDGAISVRGAGASVTVRTFSGSIDAQGRALRLDARSTTGSIFVQGRVGRLDVESMSGCVTLDLRDVQSAEITTVSGAISASCTFASPETVNLFRASSDRGPINLAVSPHLAASFEMTLTPEAWIDEGRGAPPAGASTTWEELNARLRVPPEVAGRVRSSIMVRGMDTVVVGSDGTRTSEAFAPRIDRLTRSFSTGSDSTQICLASRDGTISVEFRDLP